MVGSLHFGGRRSGFCRGSEEGDLYSEEEDLCWFVGMVGFDWGICGYGVFAVGLNVGGAKRGGALGWGTGRT